MIAIVTGGTGALGQAVTLRLLRDGGTVAVPWIVPAERAALLARVPAHHAPRLLLEACDVNADGAMEAFAHTVAERCGPVNVLVTTVGGFAGGGLAETDRATWDRMLTLNLTSAFVAAQAVVPRMRTAAYGRIVTVASRAVVPPAGGFIAYTVSKAGVIAFTQALAAELKSTRITVNAVLPSTMDTPGNRAAMPDADPAAWVPVDSVADAIAFLVREESAHITGSLLTI